MKNLILVSILLISANAFAQKSSGAEIINPTFIAKPGDFIVDGSFTYSTSSYDQQQTTGGSNIKINTTETQVTDLDAAVKFGVMDKLEIGGSVGFTANKSVQDGTSDLVSNGLKDIEAYGKYRIFKQGDKKFNLDGYAAISPGFLNNEEPVNQDQGNVFRGGTKLTLRGIMSSKLDNISWSGFFGIDYYSTITHYSATTGDENSSESSRVDISLGALAQFTLNQKMYIDVGVDLNRIDTRTETGNGSSIEITYDPVMQFVLKSKFYYAFSQTLIANASFNFINNLDAQIQSGNQTFEYIINRGFQFGAGATFKF